MNTNGHVKQALSGREAAALAALIGVGGGTAAGVAGGTAGLAAGGLAGLGGGYAAGRIRKKLRRNAENRQRDYYSSAQTKHAFDKKMMLCLAATGRDVEKIAEAYEAELEKIGGIWSSGKRLAGEALERVGGWFGRGAKRAVGPTTAQMRLAEGTQGVSFSGPGGARQTGNLTGAAKDRALKRHAGLPKPGDPAVHVPGQQPVAAQPAASGANIMGQGGRFTATGGQPAASGANIMGQGGATTGMVPQGAVPVVQGGAQPVAAPVDDIFSQMANYGNQGLTAGRDFLNNQLGLQLGSEAGALGGQGVQQWFSALQPAQQAKVLAPLALGGIGATGLAAGTAGLGAGLIGGGFTGAALS